MDRITKVRATRIHHYAVIHAGTVRIGEGATIWQFASVIRGAEIGEGTSVAACAIVDGAKVGARCAVGHGAQIHPGTVIGDDVFIGPGAIFCNDLWPQVGKDGFDADALESKSTVIVGNGAAIGAGAIIMPGVTIRPGAIVAAGVVCKVSVPGNTILTRAGQIEPLPKDRGASRRMRWAEP